MKSKVKEGYLEGYIYIIKNNVNDKVYIGQTLKNNTTRFSDHISQTYMKTYNANMAIHSAIKKYGREHFWVELVETLFGTDKESLKEEMNKREVYYIGYYNSKSPNGYNLTDGGDSCSKRRCLPVYKVSYEGDVLQKYDSISDAAIDNELPIDSVNNAVYSKTHYCHGVYFYLVDTLDVTIGDNIGKQKYAISKPVYQFDFNDVLIGKYNSVNEAGRSIGISASNISRVCRNELYSAGGYKWSFTDKPNEPREDVKRCTNKSGIDMFDIDGKFIRTFETMKAACDYVGKSRSKISRCCNKYIDSAYGYKWAYHSENINKEVVANG